MRLPRVQDPLWSDSWHCPTCGQGFTRAAGLRGAAWRASVEDHLAECQRAAPPVLHPRERREANAYILSRLARASDLLAQARRAFEQHGADSVAFECALVSAQSEMMEAEKQALALQHTQRRD
jgi:hypothetical protein